MSVVIKDMKLPKEGFVELLIRSDGLVQQTGQTKRIDGMDYYQPYEGETPHEYSAIELPPHGRLVDTLALETMIKDYPYGFRGMIKTDIANAPTVLEAEMETENDKT